MADKNVDSVVMEVSSQGLELHRVNCCNFDIGIFTNLSQDHISPNEHHSMEDYFNAKLKLFKMCKTGVVNIDHPYGEEVIQKAECRVRTYGIEKDADIKALNIVSNKSYVEFDLVLGASTDDMAAGLEKISVPGRAEIIYTGNGFAVLTDYAHTPDSLENILKIIKNSSEGRVVCVFGCGGDKDRIKRPLMGEISGRTTDFTIITSDNPRTEEPNAIIREIEEGIKKTYDEFISIEDHREAIKYAIMNAKPGDIISCKRND